MLDIAIAYNRYKFLGHEFLTWIWFVTEKNPSLLGGLSPSSVGMTVGNRIVFENRRHNSKETITIKGDDADLEEGRVALLKGALVTELHLVLTIEEQQWQCTLIGESLSLSNLKTPECGRPQSPEDYEGVVLEKVYLYEQLVTLLDGLFEHFIKIRLGDDWTQKTVPEIQNWLKPSSA